MTPDEAFEKLSVYFSAVHTFVNRGVTMSLAFKSNKERQLKLPIEHRMWSIDIGTDKIWRRDHTTALWQLVKDVKHQGNILGEDVAIDTQEIRFH